jgi:predicted RNase H-like HicB family nuclease
MSTIHISNVVWKESNYFVSRFLNIDISSFGDTKEEAQSNLQEALELYFEDNKHPRFTPIEKPELVNSVLLYV